LAIPGLAKLGVEINKEFDKIPTFSPRAMSIEDFESTYVVRAGYTADLVSTDMERLEVDRRRRDGEFRFG
jgi:hypothetical protein